MHPSVYCFYLCDDVFLGEREQHIQKRQLEADWTVKRYSVHIHLQSDNMTHAVLERPHATVNRVQYFKHLHSHICLFLYLFI